MNQPQVIELKNQRLLTTDQLAEFYGSTVQQVKQNFNNNKEKFIEGKHFYKLEGESLKEFKNRVENFDLVGKNANQLYLWTKQGASRHSKMLGTDQAWDMFDELEENYFNPRPQNVLMTPQEQLRLMFAYQEETTVRVEVIESDLKEMKENQLLTSPDYDTISQMVRRKVSIIAKEQHLVNKQKSLLFKDLNSGIKVITGAINRQRIKAKQFEEVIEFINNWQPSTATNTLIKQICLEI